MSKNMSEILGIPEELIEPEALTREQQKIKIRTEKRKFGKIVTVVDGFDKTVNTKSLAKKFKKVLGCGGTHGDGYIELQGNHVKKVRDLLIEEGFPDENIDVIT